MATIKKYTNSKGTFYEAFAYLGTDDMTGKQIRKHKKGFLTVRDAENWAEEVRVEVRRNGLPNTPKTTKKMTYRDVYDTWIGQYEYQVKESTFLKTTRQFQNHILPIFGKCRINKITSRMCQDAVNGWRDKLVNYTQVYHYFHKVLVEALEEGLITRDPCERVKIPKPKEVIEDEESINYWSKEDLATFLEACQKDERHVIYPFFRLLAYTGLRRGEILALRWTDISFVESNLKVRQALTTNKEGEIIFGTPKNKSSRRTVTIDPETLQVLRKWKSQQAQRMLSIGRSTAGKGQLVFTNEFNRMINAPRPGKWLKQIAETVKVRVITIHGLRHTHCTLLLEAGVNVKEVQKRLGHSDIETTLQTYAHVNERRSEQVPQEFANYVMGG